MAEALYQIRGRQIGTDDLSEIRETIAEHWARGRSAISRVLCERWDWRQPNGQLKNGLPGAVALTGNKGCAYVATQKEGELSRSPKGRPPGL